MSSTSGLWLQSSAIAHIISVLLWRLKELGALVSNIRDGKLRRMYCFFLTYCKWKSKTCEFQNQRIYDYDKYVFVSTLFKKYSWILTYFKQCYKVTCKKATKSYLHMYLTQRVKYMIDWKKKINVICYSRR